MTDEKSDDPISMTEDGIPLFVNGRELSKMEIEALREAKTRRDAILLQDQETEIGGADRDTNPTRFGDWEKGGRAVDF